MENDGNSYERGFQDGYQDAKAYVPPKGSRLWSKDYRDGYSDGYAEGNEVEYQY